VLRVGNRVNYKYCAVLGPKGKGWCIKWHERWAFLLISGESGEEGRGDGLVGVLEGFIVGCWKGGRSPHLLGVVAIRENSGIYILWL